MHSPQIVGYFIEEAKEHLDTLERGLLNLQATMADTEMLNELFRAAHSVKGGAAMLGFGSIQKAAHRLEDSFKILKDTPIKVDQKLESLFLSSLDTLRELTEQIQSPFGLREEEAERVLQEAEPTFVQLQQHLDGLAQVTGGQAPAVAASTPAIAVPPNFSMQVTTVLKQMLVFFKQPDSPAGRQQLTQQCDQLLQLGVNTESWCTVVALVRQAIGNPKTPYSTLAPIVIKDLKQNGDLLHVGKGSNVAPSPALQKLAAIPEIPQLTIVLEPKAAAQALAQAFDKKQLTELVKLLLPVVK